MPTPVSRTLIKHWEPPLCTVTVIEPLRVYLTALDIKLSMIGFPHVRVDVGQRLAAVEDEFEPAPLAQFGE